MAINKHLELVKRELGFIGREVQRIGCTDSDAFETVDAIGQAVQIALTALFENDLDQQPAMEDDDLAA